MLPCSHRPPNPPIFSPDGRTLATASGDRTLKLWNVATRREMGWIRHNAPIVYVGFSPDNRCLGYICDHDNLNLMRCPSVAQIESEIAAVPLLSAFSIGNHTP